MNWYFVGIGGCGMAALAKVFLEKGDAVQGSDLADSAAVAILRRHGATVHRGHRAEQVPADTDRLVVSSAIPADNPEVLEAQRRGIPCLHRSEALALLCAEQQTIGVAGTHGKTTTASMLATILVRSGLRPTCVIGGHMPLLDGNGCYGTGPHLVAEADESDSSFLVIPTHQPVVTNIEDDHLGFYGSRERMFAAFREYLDRSQRRGGASPVLGIDCPGVRELAAGVPGAVTFGFGASADYRAGLPRNAGGVQAFSVTMPDGQTVECKIHLPGQHNVQNALAAFACARGLGVEPETIATALAAHTGVSRRYECKGRAGKITVIDDYAHHPTEIESLLQGARETGPGRLLAVFQPHRYTRTAQFQDSFGAVLAACDLALVTDVYSAGEPPIEGIGAQILVEKAASPRVCYGGSRTRAATRLAREARDGDLLLTVGAGDITATGEAILANLEFSRQTGLSPAIEDLRAHCSWGVGGLAACFLEPRTAAEAQAVLEQTGGDLFVLGNGSNVLFPDRLVTTPILHIGRRMAGCEAEGTRVRVRAGTALAELSRAALERGLGGLEELGWIPGTLGGALYMNAGAGESGIHDRLVSVTLLDGEGLRTVPAREIVRGYRYTGWMDAASPVVILEAELELETRPRDAIRQRIQEAGRARRRQPAGRSAGSTFRNPPGDSAGRLIEACGLKGRVRGGARVSPCHANFIVNENEATAADILELVRICQERVQDRFGIRLELEIRIPDL